MSHGYTIVSPEGLTIYWREPWRDVVIERQIFPVVDLVGGAVLVEIVFSWGGAGQYAVQGVLNSDIYPVLGFVLFSAVFSLIVYIVVDLIYFLLDPRISN